MIALERSLVGMRPVRLQDEEAEDVHACSETGREHGNPLITRPHELKVHFVQVVERQPHVREEEDLGRQVREAEQPEPWRAQKGHTHLEVPH